MKRSVIGIDPGNTGAIVVYNGVALNCIDMPVVQIDRGGRKVVRVDASLLANALRYLQGQNVSAFVELVNAMPKQGISSTAAFMRGAGIIEGVLAGLEIPYTLVTPQRWQKALAVPKGKDGSRARAAALLPKYRGLFVRKKDDGRADAALISLFGWAQRMG